MAPPARRVRTALAWLTALSLACLVTSRVGIGARTDDAQDARALMMAGRYDEAETAADRLLKSTPTTPAWSPARRDATAIWLDARLYNGRGGALGTRQLAEAAASAHPSPRSLRQLAAIYVASGDHQKAITAASSAVAAGERAGPAAREELAASLAALGDAHTELGQYAPAAQAFTRALGVSSSRELRTAVLTRLAYGAAVRGDHAAADQHLAAASREAQHLPAEHPVRANVLHVRGQLAWFLGNFAEDARLQREALSAASAVLRPDHPSIALFLIELASAEIGLARNDEAKRLLERALRILSAEGIDHPAIANALNDLATRHLSAGEYLEARPLYQRALALYDRRFGTGHLNSVPTIYNLGVVSREIGDWPEARHYYERAVALWSRHLGAEHRNVALALSALGELMIDEGDYRGAASALSRAHRIRVQTIGASHPDVAFTLAVLARAQHAMGQTTAALRNVDRALAVWESSGIRHSEWVRALTHSADLRVLRGQVDEPRGRYERALKRAKALSGSEHPDSVRVESRLALLLARSGRTTGVTRQVLSAAAAAREYLRSTVGALPERQALALVANTARPLDVAASMLAAGVPDAAALVNQIADETIRARALVLDEIAGRANVTNEPGLELLRRAVNAARQQLATLALQTTDEGDLEQHQAALDAARRKKEQAEQQLAERSAGFRNQLARRAIGLNEVRRSLAPQAVVVAYLRYQHSELRSLAAYDSYAAFVFGGGDSAVKFVPLGRADEIDRLVERWRGSMRPDEPPAGGEQLRRRIWDPVSIHLRSARLVFVVPDGRLARIPFSALPTSPTEYLVQSDVVLHYLTAERDLVTPRMASTGQGLLAIGGPDYGSKGKRPSPQTALNRATCGNPGSMTFGPLPAARQEARDVASLWDSTQGKPELVTGREATEAEFRGAAPGKRVLHLATHGFFLADTCGRGDVRTRALQLHNPLLLSGLVFAGANVGEGKTGENDGILTAEEVASLDLAGVEWAVLSACDTGLGELAQHEDVLGLRRAFQIAGVRTVIMSLWAVEDVTTRRWMRALYEARLRKQMDTASAVREASLAVLNERRARGLSTHPFFWAGLVAAGDWR